MGAEQALADGVIASAMQRTGRDDFGPNTFREGLEILLLSALEAKPPRRWPVWKTPAPTP